MLVLTRKKNDTIEIGVGEEKIVIQVCSVSGNSTRIGIVAPKDVPILRGELDRRPRPEKGAA